MIKSPILDLQYSSDYIKNTIRSKWFSLLILVPIALYATYLFFETQMVVFVAGLFPKEPDKSFGFYRDFVRLIFNELLWLSGFLLLAWIFVIYVPLSRAMSAIETRILSMEKGFFFLVVAVSFGITLFVAFDVLEGFPNSSDEYAYLYQAKTLGKGQLWEYAHDLPKFFYFNHIAQTEGISVGRFPPGWPALLSTAMVLKISPLLINPLLSVLGLIVFYAFAERTYGKRVAIWALPAMALTSFYMYNGASLFSHTSCMLASLMFVMGIYLYKDNPNPWFLIISGLFLGLMITIRYFTAAIVSLPFFFYLIYLYRWKVFLVFFLMGIGILPCLLAMGWYNYSITGNALLPVTVWAYEDESLGFVRGHTAVKGLEHLARWMFMFLYWCSPGVLIIYVFSIFNNLRHAKRRFVHPEDYIFILLAIGYFFYYQIGGNQYGPRFLFEALPFVILLTVNTVVQQRRKWAIAFLFAGAIYALVKIPFISYREHVVVRERNDVYDKVQRAGITDAVVFISSHTGVIRPMPVGDLIRNDVHFQNEVIYAHDLGERNAQLMDYYPNRKYYRYDRHPESSQGSLAEIARE